MAVVGLLNTASTVRADDSVGTISQLSGAAQFNAAARRSLLSKGRRSDFTTR